MTDEPEPEPDRQAWMLGRAREAYERGRMRRARLASLRDGVRFELWRRRIADATVRIGRPR